MIARPLEAAAGDVNDAAAQLMSATAADAEAVSQAEAAADAADAAATTAGAATAEGGSSAGIEWTIRLEWQAGTRLGLSLTQLSGDGVATVSSVQPGSAAAQALAVGDRLLAINGQPTPRHDQEGVAAMLRAAESPMELTVQAPSSTEERYAAGQAGQQAWWRRPIGAVGRRPA